MPFIHSFPDFQGFTQISLKIPLDVGSPEDCELEGVGVAMLPVLMLKFKMLDNSICLIAKSQGLLVLPAPLVAAVPTGPQIASRAEIAGEFVDNLGPPAAAPIIH